MGSLLDIAVEAAAEIAPRSMFCQPANAAAHARETRQARVEAELRARPELRVAFDVADTPLKGSPGGPVSVILAVRHGDQILSGELHVAR